MRIKFYAHASFRLEANGLAVITAPYTPGPQNTGFNPIDESADIVIPGLCSSTGFRAYPAPRHLDTSKNLHRRKTALNDLNRLAERESGTKGVLGDAVIGGEPVDILRSGFTGWRCSQ